MSKPMAGRASAAQDKKWQAECDVRTLMQAQEIQKDRARMAMAQKAAANQAKEAAKVAQTMKRKGK